MKKMLFKMAAGLALCSGSLSFSTTVQAQSQVEKAVWHIGGERPDAGNDICQTTDGGCIITGYTFSYGQNADPYRCDLYAVKLNASGAVEWTRTVGGSDFDFGHSVRQTSDGGYIICGRSISITNGSHFNVYLVKLSPSGVVEWTKAIGPTGYGMAFGNDICLTNDGGFAFSGTNQRNVFVGKTDSLGNVLWTRAIGNPDVNGTNVDDEGEAIDLTADGGLIIAGSTNSYGAGGYDVYVVKLSASGNLEWTKTFGSSENDFGKAVKSTSDGGFIVAGYTQAPSKDGNIGDMSTYFLKLNSSGDLQWAKTYGAAKDDYAVAVQQTQDGGYISAGYTQSFGSDSSSYLAMKLSGEGSLEWVSTIDSQGNTTNANNGRYGICQTADGGYAGVGLSYQRNAGGGIDNQIFVVKFDASGHTCSGNESTFGEGSTNTNVTSDSGQIITLNTPSTQGGISGSGGDYQVICQVGGTASVSETTSSNNTLSIYPNPAITQLYLKCNGAEGQENARLTIYDVFGRKLLQKEISRQTTFSMVLNIETLNPGTYFINVVSSGRTLLKQKFLKY